MNLSAYSIVILCTYQCMPKTKFKQTKQDKKEVQLGISQQDRQDWRAGSLSSSWPATDNQIFVACFLYLLPTHDVASQPCYLAYNNHKGENL